MNNLPHIEAIPDLHLERFVIYNNDAYKQIEHFVQADLKVDHIITDPPYNISQDNNFGTMRNPRQGVDFGQWDRGTFNLFAWIPLYSRLLMPNGSMIIFCSYRYLSDIIHVLEQEAGMDVKDIIVWQKKNPMPRNTTRRYVQDMEFAIWAVKKNSKWIFNKPDDVPYLRALYTTGLVAGKERLGHPTQKSLQLMKDLISIHTNKDQLILDPFMGSGSTGEASLMLGRRFVGVEMSPEYYVMSKKRLMKYENLGLF